MAVAFTVARLLARATRSTRWPWATTSLGPMSGAGHFGGKAGGSGARSPRLRAAMTGLSLEAPDAPAADVHRWLRKFADRTIVVQRVRNLPELRPSAPPTRSFSSSFSTPPIPTPIRIAAPAAAGPRRRRTSCCRSGWAHPMHGCTTIAGRWACRPAQGCHRDAGGHGDRGGAER